MSFATEYGLYHPRYGWSYNSNVASGNFSAAFGSNTKATKEAQFVCWKQNEEDTDGRYQFIVGVGGKNGFAVTTRGEIVMPDPNASSTTYMKARFNSDGTIRELTINSLTSVHEGNTEKTDVKKDVYEDVSFDKRAVI